MNAPERRSPENRAPTKLTVVVPAYDEETTIGELLRRMGGVRVASCETDVLVVDDGSKDATVRVARSFGARVVSHTENRGLGAAVRTGLSEAVSGGADVIAYLDADLEYSPEDIPDLVEPILSCRAEYVLGSRSDLTGMRIYRRVGNAAFSALLSAFCGRWVADGQTGMRAFSRRAASAAEIVHDYNYAQVLTLDLLQKGFSMEEIPVSYRLREHGESFVDWRYPLKVLPAIWREVFDGRVETPLAMLPTKPLGGVAESGLDLPQSKNHTPGA